MHQYLATVDDLRGEAVPSTLLRYNRSSRAACVLFSVPAIPKLINFNYELVEFQMFRVKQQACSDAATLPENRRLLIDYFVKSVMFAFYEGNRDQLIHTSRNDDTWCDSDLTNGDIRLAVDVSTLDFDWNELNWFETPIGRSRQFYAVYGPSQYSAMTGYICSAMTMSKMGAHLFFPDGLLPIAVFDVMVGLRAMYASRHYPMSAREADDARVLAKGMVSCMRLF